MSFTQDAQSVWRLDGTPPSVNGQKHEANLALLSIQMTRRIHAAKYCTGLGTAASPYVSASGTAGIQEACDALGTLGGTVLAQGYCGMTATVTLTTHRNITIDGGNPSFGIDGGAGGGDALSVAGTQLVWTGTPCDGFRIGRVDTGVEERTGGITIRNMALNGNNQALPTFAEGSAEILAQIQGAIAFTESSDGTKIENIYARNWVAGVHSPAGAVPDNAVFRKCDFINCVRPFNIAVMWHSYIIGCLAADCRWGAIVGGEHVHMHSCDFVRMCDTTSAGQTGGVSLTLLWGVNNGTIIGCDFCSAAVHNFTFASIDAMRFGKLIKISGSRNQMSGCFLAGANNQNILWVAAADNRFSDLQYGGTYSTEMAYVGAFTGITINLPGWTIYNDGTGLILNGGIAAGGGGTWGADRQVQIRSVTSQFNKTNNDTPSVVTGLEFNVLAGRRYAFRAVLHTAANGTAGFNFGIGGTATATAVIFSVRGEDSFATVVVWDRVSTFGAGGVSGGAGSETIETVIEGVVTVANAGTIAPIFAQYVATPATTSTILVGSTFELSLIG